MGKEKLAGWRMREAGRHVCPGESCVEGGGREEWTPEPCESPGCDWGSAYWLQLPRFYLCTPSLRMDSSHATKSCVLILLVTLLCAERGEMENERGAGGYNGDGKGTLVCGYTCTSIVCLVSEAC